MLPDIGVVNFRQRILMLADNDSAVVLLEEKVLAVTGQRIENVLLQRQIKGGVGGGDIDVYRVFQMCHTLSTGIGDGVRRFIISGYSASA